MSAILYAGVVVSCGSSEGTNPGTTNNPASNAGANSSAGNTSKGGNSNKGGGSNSGGTSSTGGSLSTGSGGSAGFDASGGRHATSSGGNNTGGSDANGGNAGSPATGGTHSSAGTTGNPDERIARIAFVGDQGNNSDTELALEQLKEHKVDLAVILGDFDYADDPDAWQELMSSRLGADFPWIAVGGNHDVAGWAGYKKIIEDKVKTVAGLEYSGTPGEAASYTFKGIQIITSGIKTFGDVNDQKALLEKDLKASSAAWKICAWHKVHSDMNTGMKGVVDWPPGDEVPIDAYTLCAKYNAFIMSGHEHAYSRTRTLNCVGKDDPEDHCADQEVVDEVEVGGGKTFVTVSGLGGREIRDFFGLAHDDDNWWASYYTKNKEMVKGKVANVDNSKAGVGVTFVDFGVDGDPKKAHAFFKIAQTGRVVDDYVIRLK